MLFDLPAHRLLLLFCVLLLIGPRQLRGQQFDLGFEGRHSSGASYRTWFVGGEGFVGHPDSVVRHGGRQSMHLAAVPFGPDHYGAWGGVVRRLPAAQVAGHRLTVSAWVRTDSLLDGGAALFCQASTIHWEQLQDVHSDTLRGHTTWRQLTLTTNVSPRALDVQIGCRVAGWGSAWIDDVQLFLDGKPLPLTALPAAPMPTPRELRWLRKVIHPLCSLNPAEPAQDDLAAFGMLLGNARLIALGEASHGTHEAMAAKARLIRYLVQQQQLEVVIFEARG